VGGGPGIVGDCLQGAGLNTCEGPGACGQPDPVAPPELLAPVSPTRVDW
jgi:hypothetical protein